jgi:8-oxo-dGTP diphosphatase
MKLFVGTKGVVHYKSKILLLRESSLYEEGAEEGKWDVPGGRIEEGETLQEGLLREVKEETGLTVSKGRLLGAYDGFPVIKGEKCHVVRLYFLCESDTDQVELSKDHDAYAWVGEEDDEKVLMDDIREMIKEAQQFI